MSVVISLFAGAGAQFFDNSGDPLTGGLIYTYAAGTTTPLATYTSSSGSTAHTNPIVLDAAGRVNEIWLTDNVEYKFILKTSGGVTIATYDNVYGGISVNSPTFIGNVTITGNLSVSGDATITGNVTGTWNGNVIPVAKGGTGASTAATARTNLGAAATGDVTASGLTMNTSRLLGRTTASSGAIEEIAIGSGLSLSAGTLSVPPASIVQLREQLFTASGSWVAPSGVTQAQLVVIGAGGGGGGRTTSGCGNDGGAGGYGGIATGNVTVTPGTTYTVTIGTGGTGGGDNANGTAGGTTSIGALMSATGGGAGLTNGTTGANGSGSGGTTRNASTAVTTMSPFGGSGIRVGGSGTAPVAWSAAATQGAGTPGGGGSFGCATTGAGGLNGLVYVQWVG